MTCHGGGQGAFLPAYRYLLSYGIPPPETRCSAFSYMVPKSGPCWAVHMACGSVCRSGLQGGMKERRKLSGIWHLFSISFTTRYLVSHGGELKGKGQSFLRRNREVVSKLCLWSVQKRKIGE